MKKIYILLSLLILTGALAGCTGIFQTTAGGELTFLTSKKTVSTTSNTIDKDMLISDVYEMIYSEIYNEVKAEVIENISEERFNEMYSDMVEELLTKVANGDIDISADSIIDMINNVEETSANSVIGVTSLNENGVAQAIGSGVIYKHVGNTYYVITNNHVVEDGSSYEVRFEDGSTLEAILKGVDDLVDVAVLYFISEDDYQVVEFADSDLVSKGDIVLAVGNSNGYDFYGSMTMGIVSGLNRYFDVDNDGINDMFVNYIQHDAAINAGNSGGALFDINGDVIGINVIKLSATEIEGMGFSIPSNLVKAICEDIEEFGYSKQKPVLGINFIQIRNNETALAENEYIVPDTIEDGFYIVEVYEGSSLYGYVEAGDIIVNIGDIDITTAEDFIFEFSKFLVDDTISITYFRDGAYHTVDDIVLKAAVN